MNNWELTQSHFEGKIVVIAKTEETNLLTHKAEDGLAEADDPEDEEDEEDEEEEEEDTATLGDEELKMQILQMPQFTQTREKSLSQKAQMSCFSRKYNYPELVVDGEDDEEELAKRPRGGAFAEE